MAKRKIDFYRRPENKKLKEKKARNIKRLLTHGAELIQTGNLTIKPSNIDEIKDFELLSIEEIIKVGEQETEQLKNMDCILPSDPNFEKINTLLIEQRKCLL